ncbi:hypothetical protein ABH935_009460 [Catenulispora sp. GAS73]|uniref:hypothetical protein n=1 Tax=Catenulispora sp. GAS73 TaxID=3156269 RepID=UPI0035186553
MFGLVLGLLSWLHIQAQLTLFVVEADRESFTAYAKVEERHDEVTVDVTVDDSGGGR